MKRDAKAVVAAVERQRDVVDVRPGQEKARRLYRSAFTARAERFVGFARFENDEDGWHRRGELDTREHASERGAELLQAHGYVLQRLLAGIAEHDEVRRSDHPPLRLGDRAGRHGERDEQRQQRGGGTSH